jgi:hypothetical protein
MKALTSWTHGPWTTRRIIWTVILAFVALSFLSFLFLALGSGGGSTGTGPIIQH